MHIPVLLACMLEHHVWAVPKEDRQGVFPRSEVMDVAAAMCVLGTKTTSQLCLWSLKHPTAPTGIYFISCFSSLIFLI